MIRALADAHRFFVEKTPDYMAGSTYTAWEYRRAWLRFMGYTLIDTGPIFRARVWGKRITLWVTGCLP